MVLKPGRPRFRGRHGQVLMRTLAGCRLPPPPHVFTCWRAKRGSELSRDCCKGINSIQEASILTATSNPSASPPNHTPSEDRVPTYESDMDINIQSITIVQYVFIQVSNNQIIWCSYKSITIMQQQSTQQTCCVHTSL